MRHLQKGIPTNLFFIEVISKDNIKRSFGPWSFRPTAYFEQVKWNIKSKEIIEFNLVEGNYIRVAPPNS